MGTDLRTAAQQALEALEYLGVTAEHRVDDRIPDAAITALKAALEQPEPELHLDGMTPLQFALEELHAFQEATGCDTAFEFRAALEQTAKCDGGTCGLGGYCDECPKRQPEQVPVAWMHRHIEGNVITHRPADLDRHPDRWTPLYKNPTPCETCQALARTVMMDQMGAA